MHACIYIYIYLLFVGKKLIWKEFCRNVFRPVRQSGIPVRSTGILAKAGEFLSYKHSVPLCRDDIMLTLQIVLGEIVPAGINIDIQQLLSIRQVRLHQFKTLSYLDYWSGFSISMEIQIKKCSRGLIKQYLNRKKYEHRFFVPFIHSSDFGVLRQTREKPCLLRII